MTNTDYAVAAEQFLVTLDEDDAAACLYARVPDWNYEETEIVLVAEFTGAFDERAVRAKLRTLFCGEVADLIEIAAAK